MELLSDTIGASFLFYRENDVLAADSGLWNGQFGQYRFFPTDSNGLFFDFQNNAHNPPRHFSSGFMGELLPYPVELQSSFFLLFLLGLVSFAAIFRWEGNALRGSFSTVFTPRKYYASVHKRQITSTEAWGELFLVMQSVMVFSVFLFSWGWDYFFSGLSLPVRLWSFVALFLGVGIWVYLKIVGYRLIGMFFLTNESQGWVTYYIRVVEILGIISFFPVTLYLYLHEIRNIILWVILLLFFISRVVIYIELLNIFVKNKISPFYFFVYLCGTEIAPYLLLYKGLFSVITIAGDNIL